MKKMIFVVICIIIIIIAMLIILLNNNQIIQGEENQIEGKSDVITIENTNKIEYPDNRTNAFLIKQLVDEYMNYVTGKRAEELLDIINNNYVEEENITINNIIEKVKEDDIKYSKNYKAMINSLYLVKQDINYELYFVNLIYCNMENNNNYDTKLIIQIDMQNNTFAVMPYKYMKKMGYDKLQLGDECKINMISIEKKQNNIFQIVPISQNSTAERYFNIFMDYLQYDKQKSYYLLDKEYREKRFENIDEYTQYINNNKLYESSLKSYNVYSYDNYTQFVCIDNENKYYIFNEVGIMNFETILDTYTIDLPQFVEKYESSSDENKILLNFQKCFEALNNKDYKYVYSKLDETFKNNNFKTQEQFEQYARKTFFDSNKAKASNGKVQGNIYMYEVTITDKTETNKNSINKTFIMQLKEETDFIMSFSV